MTDAETVVVVARWKTTGESLGAVLALVAELVPQSLAEPGCLGYEVFEIVDEANAVMVVERYRDSTSHDAHRNSAHFQDLVVRRILPLLTDRRVEVLTPLS